MSGLLKATPKTCLYRERRGVKGIPGINTTAVAKAQRQKTAWPGFTREELGVTGPQEGQEMS